MRTWTAAMTMPNERLLQVGHGWFDPLAGDLTLGGRTTKLRPRTAALLAYLVRHPDRVVGKEELLQSIWPDVVVTEDSLVQCVKEIRRAFGQAGHDWIRTVPRQGYAFVACAPALPSTEAVADAAGPRAAPRPSRRLLWLALAALLAVLGVFGALTLRGPSAPPPPPLSVVVLPLANASGQAAREDAVDEMTERLADALSRMPGAMVIAPSTAFTYKGKAVDVRRVGAELAVRYVLEGSLRQHDERLVLNLRLADTSSAAQLWNQEFMVDARQAALREEVATRVAGSLGLRLISAEAQRSEREQAREPGAADLLTRARAALRWSGLGAEGVAKARPLLEEAVRRDANSAEAWALLSRVYLDEIRFRDDRAGDLQRAAEAADRALALAPLNAEAQGAKARVLYNHGRMPQALDAFERAIELNPSEPNWHAHRAAALITLGRPDEALHALESARRLSPRDPQLPLWQMFEGVAYLHLRRDAEAIEVLTRSVQGNPRSGFGHLFLASALGLSGRAEQGRQHVAELRRMHPEFTLARMREREPSDAPAFLAQRQRVYEGLRLAGLPD